MPATSPYTFFFSYARDSADPYLIEFFGELDAEVRGLLGKRKGDPVGWFDQKDIPLGGSWPEELAEALASTSVLVPVYAPVYFQKPNCGREVQVFLERRQAFIDTHPGERPNCILPVLWFPLEKLPLPPALVDLQDHLAGFGADYETEGLQYIKSKSSLADSYRTFLRKFARRVKEAADGSRLPSLAPAPGFDGVVDAFEAPPSRTSAMGPGAVAFVYVAAQRDEIGPHRTDRSPYGDAGWQWRPFRSESEVRIGPLTQSVGSASLYRQEIPSGAGLVDRLREARTRNNMVVIVVDAWTLCVESYRRRMEEYDRENFRNCAVLVVWDQDDPETQAHRDELEQLAAYTFQNNATKDRRFFIESVPSLAGLRDALAGALSNLQLMLINRPEAPPRRIPGVSQVPLPHIQGPGSLGVPLGG